mmetsp:Transcript_50171/g.92757  ORF Transcript_50171/g.92757 Transcript_50171/m.92757 type:complete len:262 (+) Transcript_50171:857-1642(+)
MVGWWTITTMVLNIAGIILTTTIAVVDAAAAGAGTTAVDRPVGAHLPGLEVLEGDIIVTVDIMDVAAENTVGEVIAVADREATAEAGTVTGTEAGVTETGEEQAIGIARAEVVGDVVLAVGALLQPGRRGRLGHRDIVVATVGAKVEAEATERVHLGDEEEIENARAMEQEATRLKSNEEGVAGAEVLAYPRVIQGLAQGVVVGQRKRGMGKTETGAEVGAGAGDVVGEGNEAARIVTEKNRQRGIAEAEVGQRVTDQLRF